MMKSVCLFSIRVGGDYVPSCIVILSFNKIAKDAAAAAADEPFTQHFLLLAIISVREREREEKRKTNSFLVIYTSSSVYVKSA